MVHHCSAGDLRAYHDDELAPDARGAVETHVAICAPCRAELAAVGARADSAAALLAPPAAPDQRAAYARFAAALPAPRQLRRSAMNLPFSRRAIASVAAAALALCLFLLPPVRAAADDFLNIFRVQSVVLMPLSEARADQLRGLNFDQSTLFVGKPTLANERADATPATGAADAATKAGFAPSEVTALPAGATASYTVMPANRGEATANVAGVRQMLTLLDITDLAIPDALGSAPTVVDIKPIVETSYVGDGFGLTLIQGTAPKITLPDGVDAALPNRVMLRVLGMDAAQADTIAGQMDLRSTLIVPIPPTEVQRVRAVTVNGAQGLLAQLGGGEEGQRLQLYWQVGERFYVLRSTNGDETALLAAAESVR